jgi:hypothetical protein
MKKLGMKVATKKPTISAFLRCCFGFMIHH